MSARRLRAAIRKHRLRAGGPRHSRTGRKHIDMSLINDALRRTSRSQAPPATPAKTPPLQPVEPARSHAHLALVLAPVIILLLGLAGWFWVKWWESSTQMNQTPNPTRVAAREVPRAPDPTPGISPGDGLPPRE